MSALSMGKFVGGKQNLGPRGKDIIGGAISESLANLGSQAGKELKTQRSMQTAMDPNTSPLMRAFALAQAGSDPLAVQFLKNQTAEQNQRASEALIADAEARARGLKGQTQEEQNFAVQPNSREDFIQRTLGTIPQERQVQQQIPQNVPQNQEANLDQLRKEADIYDDLATQLARANPAQANKYSNKSNQIRKDIRTAETNATKLQIADINAKNQQELENKRTSQNYVNKILDSYQGSKTSEAILGDMERLARKGNLTTPAMSSLLGKFKIPIGILNNPDSEEFEKLSNTLTRDIQKFYGARILASEFQNFLKQIPTLNNTPEGRLRIIDNLKKMMAPAKIEYEMYKKILKENGGKRPENLREQIIERMDPMLDKWASEFKHEFPSEEREIQEFQLPPGTVKIRSPEGKIFPVPFEKVKEALSHEGATIIP
jgi:hypothetical protein